ncbi:hypothetical protein [Streptomyces sp. MZ04]|uniref:hypothetical protein n=1 Tax=Streptomyces sp. MZ04 TaxID=2559236 RepID=UPI00107ECC92|nr:hypothetical protein [Streptomyces sp. MZ04]TGB13831.1 hypothetical protein E2651_07765 [Streptomyces sp. MZ04]
MADEPSNGELGRLISSLQGEMHRRMDTLNVRLGEFVQQNVYDTHNRYTAEALARLQSDVQQARVENAKLEDDLEQHQRDEAKRREDERQRRLYQAVIPVLLAIMSAAIAVWAVVSK